MELTLLRLFLSKPVRQLLVRLYDRHESKVEAYLERLSAKGRKKVLATFEAEVEMQRWYLLRMETDASPRLFPNAYFHKDLKVETPGDAHKHGWPSASLILRGGYRALVDGVPEEYKAGDLALLRHDQFHEVVHCEPGTTTLFIRGFRRSTFEFKLTPCATVCNRCAAKYGTCGAAVRTIPYEVTADDGLGVKWRKRMWFNANHPGLERKLRIRRKVLARAALPILTRDEFIKSQAANHDL